MSRKKKPLLIFAGTDFFGNAVELTKANLGFGPHPWLHPAMAGHETSVKRLLEAPDHIRESTVYAHGAGFISAPGFGPSPEGMRVIVNYDDTFYEKGASQSGVATAYPIDIIRYVRTRSWDVQFIRGNEMTLSYDKRADVLYIRFEDAPASERITVENEQGDVLVLNKKTNKVIACVIPAFSRRSSENIVIPEIGSIPFNELAAALIS